MRGMLADIIDGLKPVVDFSKAGDGFLASERANAAAGLVALPQLLRSLPSPALHGSFPRFVWILKRAMS